MRYSLGCGLVTVDIRGFSFFFSTIFLNEKTKVNMYMNIYIDITILEKKIPMF